MKNNLIYCSELLERNEMKTLLSETSTGLESIRFSIADNLDHLDKNLEEAKEDLKYFEYPRLWLHGPFLDLNPMCFDSLVRQATMDRFNQCYEAALELGADGIVYHSCMIPQVYFTIGWADRMIEFWNMFLEGKSGITITMENVLDREIQPFVQVAEKISHPDFGLCIDIGHAHAFADDSASDWLEAAKPYLRHAHLHDNDGSRDQHLALGDGTIPLEQIFSFLRELNHPCSFTIENQRMEDFHKSLRTLKEYGVIDE
ncbi:MAG: sugar phosphate isomerase/epimerase [Lachnospiraceae bacterium]|nr:sugar phosphate isomerase/epimerase [Lachnospiraceae bacterium]